MDILGKGTVPYVNNIGTVMSNFDHEIDEGIAERLQSEPAYAEYPAWNFHAKVWFDKINDTFLCEIWQYHSHIDTISGDLREIMGTASERFGAE